MKLLTKEIVKKAQKQYNESSDLESQKVVAKFFNPMGSWTWYLTELEEDKDYAYGIVDGHEVEIGSFLISELESLQLPFGLGIERIAMLKFGVNDIRDFYKSNLDFLKQFK